jgi:hypothetical protein
MVVKKEFDRVDTNVKNDEENEGIDQGHGRLNKHKGDQKW